MTETATTPTAATKRVELSAGPISYREAGEGEPIVFVHGFLVDGRLGSEAPRRWRASFGASSPTGRWAHTRPR